MKLEFRVCTVVSSVQENAIRTQARAVPAKIIRRIIVIAILNFCVSFAILIKILIELGII